MTVSPVSGTETVLGEAVSDLQEDIAVANGGIQGLSKYVDGFTQFSSNPAEQHGNYIVLHAEAQEGSTIQYQSVYKNGTLGSLGTVDGNGIIVVRLTENTDKMKFIATKNGTANVLYYDLDGLTLEDPEAFSISLAAGGHCTKTGDYQVYEGETATINLTADTGYIMPQTISVTGAVADYTRSSDTAGVVVLSAPTANIVVTCLCAAEEYAIDTSSSTNVSVSGDTSIVAGGTATVTFTAATNYNLPATITVNGDTGVSGSGSGVTWSYDQSTGVVSLSDAIGAVTIVCVAEMNGYTITGNLSNCHCRDIDPTEIAIGETVQWTLGGDVGYGKPAAADVSVTNATGSYDEATGVLTISNATGPVTVTASGSIVSLSQAFTIGDDISGGSTIYVNKVANIDNICASIIADTNVPSFTLNQVDYHTIACKDDFTAGTVTYPVLAVSYNTQNGSKSLVYKWGGIGNQQQQLWNSSSGWSNDIAADGSLTLGGSESGTIGLLYGDGWNGVVLGQKEQTTSGTLVGVQDFPVCSRDYFVINTYGVDMDDYCTNVLSYVTEDGYSNSHLIDGVDTTVYGGQTIKKLLWARYSGYMQYTIFAGNTPVWSSFSGTVQIDASTSVSVVAGWQNVDDGCYLRIPADDKIYIAQYGAGDQTLSTRNLVPNTWIEQFIEPIYAEDRVQTYTFKTKVSNDAIKGIMGAWPNWVSSQGYDYADFMRSNASGSTGEFIGLRLEKASGDPSQGYKYAIATSDYSAVIWASEAFSFGPLSAQAAGWQPAVVNAQYVASASTLYSPFSSPNGDWNGVFIGKAFVQDVIGGGGGSSGSGGVGGSND